MTGNHDEEGQEPKVTFSSLHTALSLPRVIRSFSFSLNLGLLSIVKTDHNVSLGSLPLSAPIMRVVNSSSVTVLQSHGDLIIVTSSFNGYRPAIQANAVMKYKWVALSQNCNSTCNSTCPDSSCFSRPKCQSKTHDPF
jgi:hypothetical protein